MRCTCNSSGRGFGRLGSCETCGGSGILTEERRLENERRFDMYRLGLLKDAIFQDPNNLKLVKYTKELEERLNRNSNA